MADREPIRLRPHHLLCILTYKGLGYTPAFTRNMSEIVGAIREGADIVLCEGPDAICSALTEADADHCHCSDPETAMMDAVAEQSLAQFLPDRIAVTGRPFRLAQTDIIQLHEAFAKGLIRKACRDCSWNATCTAIAADRFANAVILEPLPVASR
jgi:uncharacterized protein